MARRNRPAPPPPPPDAPLAAELLGGPRAFFERLRACEPRAWRYVAPVLLTAPLAGVLYALLLRPVVALGTANALTAHATNVFGNLFLTVFGYGLMAGVGYLATGREGRAAEVYGATFALLPPLYLGLAALLLVLPGPQVGSPTPGAELVGAREVLRTVAHAPLTRLTVLVVLLGTAAQFVLAYQGFLTLTGNRSRALLGSLLPLVPTLLLTAVGFAPLLVGMF